MTFVFSIKVKTDMEHNRTVSLKRIAYAGCLGVIGIISTEFGIIGVLPQVAAYYNITIDH